MDKQQLAKKYFEEAIGLFDIGDFYRAEILLEKSNQLAPNRYSIIQNLANIKFKMNKIIEAKYLSELLIELDPSEPDGWNNIAYIYYCEDKIDDAIACYTKALDLDPNYFDALMNLANILNRLSRYREALDIYLIALKIHQSPDIYRNIGNLIYALEKNIENAFVYFEKSLLSDRNNINTYINIGDVYKYENNSERSKYFYDMAFGIRPQTYEDYINLGHLSKSLGRFGDAKSYYERAETIKPHENDPKFGQSTLHLLNGNLRRGFELYENRMGKTLNSVRQFIGSTPHLSNANSLSGKTVFIYFEQGFGDTIQFCRYLKELNNIEANVIFLPQKHLSKLMTGLDANFNFYNQENIKTGIDFHCSLMSLPAIFKSTIDDLPNSVPYISINRDKIESWKNKLGREGFKIGICWKGSKNLDLTTGRSFPFQLFSELCQLQSVRLISLCKDVDEERHIAIRDNITVEFLDDDFDAGTDAFMDTAAIIKGLDLVITSDTAIAHLAGALACPVWIALSKVPDWRWMLQGDTCPWYPSATIFRQDSIGDWTPVFINIKQKLSMLYNLRSLN